MGHSGEDAEVIAGNLHRVDHSRAARVYLDPQVDFTRYTAILLDPLDLSEVEIICPAHIQRVGQAVPRRVGRHPRGV
jgi:hypothetical protein